MAAIFGFSPEKIVAAVATTFVCIADGSKLVATLGRFPLPVEVIPMARAHVARLLASMVRAENRAWRESRRQDKPPSRPRL